MNWGHNNSFGDSNFSSRSTEENEILSIESEKIRNILNIEINPENNLNDIIVKNEEKIINVIRNIFCQNKNNEEFDDLSYISNENKNNIYETSMLVKKHFQDNSINNFSHIKNINKNESKPKYFEINKIIKKNNMPIYRLDYYKKIFIKNFLKYLLKCSNDLIIKCNIKEIGEQKLHMPNYKLYAGNPKEKDNKEFLKKTIKMVFMDYDKQSKKGIGRQKSNEKLINKIYEKDFPLSEDEYSLNEFFNMTIEKGIELYYESDEFKMFKDDEINQYYDKMFYNEKNRKFSLFDKNGFIKLVNSPFYSKNPK